MAGFGDLSTTAGDNTTIGGTNVAENCPPGNVNNAIRTLGAYGRMLYDIVAAISTGMPISGGAFTGNITRDGRGAYRHNNDATLVDGRIYWLPEGTALPTPAEGMEVVFYTP